ncbi:MAG TPA: AraC family transcriptional regulator [Gemmatimonadaceae bacterium]|nr:AraC family transcriptional regulator [Gemmatimonadaceae bacterium]
MRPAASKHAIQPQAQLHYERLFSSELVDITRVCCRPNEPGCGAPEAANDHHVVVPHRGVFVKHVGKRRYIAHPAAVLFFTAGREYRVSHPVGNGDDCSSLRFASEVLQEALDSAYGGGVNESAPFDPIGTAVAPPAAELLAARRLPTLTESGASTLEIEETALALLRDALRAGRETGSSSRWARRADTEMRTRRWAEEVELHLAANPGRRWTLAALGREVGCSPYHLARRFRAVCGKSIHRSLMTIRLAIAAERALDGEDDLSGLAQELGFASHAHLTTAFRAVHGLPPSALRRASVRALPRRTRSIG